MILQPLATFAEIATRRTLAIAVFGFWPLMSSTEARPGPNITVVVENDATVARAVKIVIRYRNIPVGSGLVLSVVSGRLRDEPGGPLVVRPIKISGSGSQRFTWDGRTTYWAPADAPIPRRQVFVGTYKVIALVYDRANFSTVSRSPPPNPKLIVRSQSRRFLLQSDPDISR